MISEINAAIKQNDFQQVKILVETVIEKVSYFISMLFVCFYSIHYITNNNVCIFVY